MVLTSANLRSTAGGGSDGLFVLVPCGAYACILSSVCVYIHMFIHKYICIYVYVYVGMLYVCMGSLCQRMLAYVSICEHAPAYASMCWHVLGYASIC